MKSDLLSTKQTKLLNKAAINSHRKLVFFPVQLLCKIYHVFRLCPLFHTLQSKCLLEQDTCARALAWESISSH